MATVSSIHCLYAATLVYTPGMVASHGAGPKLTMPTCHQTGDYYHQTGALTWYHRPVSSCRHTRGPPLSPLHAPRPAPPAHCIVSWRCNSCS